MLECLVEYERYNLHSKRFSLWASFLKQALASIRNQTIGIQNIEVVIVDNFSNLRGRELFELSDIEEDVKRYHGRFIRLASRVSLGEARNVAVRNSRVCCNIYSGCDPCVDFHEANTCCCWHLPLTSSLKPGLIPM